MVSVHALAKIEPGGARSLRSSGPSPEYFLNLAGDYYQSGLEPGGLWMGSGAAAAGLAGFVGKEAFRQLVQGYAPDGRKLVQNAGSKKRQTGWDMTFSADKTISALWSQASPAVRKEIEAAHLAAIQAALRYFENHCAWTRRGQGGGHWERARIIAAAFEHSASRSGDAQLHTHLLVLNLAVRQDGTVGTLVSKPMYTNKLLMGALYRAELAVQLQSRLGLELERYGPFFRIADIPRALVHRFSTRRQEIEAVAEERGIYSSAGMEAVTLATRKAKHAVSRDELFKRWEVIGEAYGFTHREVQALIGRVRALPPAEPDSLLQQSVYEILRHESYFDRATLLRHLAEKAPGSGLDVAALEAGVDRFLTTSPEIVAVNADRYTTLGIARMEQELLDTGRTLQHEKRHLLSMSTLEHAIQAVEREESQRKGTPVTFSPQQKEALAHITTEQGDLKLVNGMAGTGKTAMLAAARHAWEARGFTVVGATLSGKAARGLEEGAGIHSSTLARLFLDLERNAGDDLKHHLNQLGRAAVGKSTWKLSERTVIDKNTVLVLDEASMIGTAMLAALVDRIKQVGAKLVLIGDEDQLQAIDAGGPFRALLRALGGKRLTEILRQNEQWAQEAVRQFAQGEAGAALTEYARRGLLHVADTRFTAIEKLMSDWAKQGVERPEEALIFTATRSDRALMNRLAQEERQRAGKLSLLPVCVNGTSFYAHDRILFTLNSRKYGVENGTMGTIVMADPWHRTLQVRLDAGRDGKERLVTFSIDKYNAVDLAYAITAHKGQGVTVNRAFLLAGGPMTNRELTYVQASRAREETRIYCDVNEAGPNLANLTRTMNRSEPKELAIMPGRPEQPLSPAL